MIEILIQNPGRIKKALTLIKNKTKIKLKLEKNKILLEGKDSDEFIIDQIIRAVDFGFETEDAILLLNPDFVLEFINIKGYTRRKNLRDVRARIIGVGGKAKRTIETLTGAAIIINNNRIGVIVNAEHLRTTINAIQSLIQGAKHANVFAYLEKQNAKLKKIDEEDLGLRE